MKSRLSMLVALGLTCALGSVSYVGCSSSSGSGGNNTTDTGTTNTNDPECNTIGTPTPLTNTTCDQTPPIPDRCNPPGKCGPTDLGDGVCKRACKTDGDCTTGHCDTTSGFCRTTCPTDTACMAPVKQSGDVLNYRMGRITLWAPASLVSLQGMAVTPFVDPSCMTPSTGEGFSWLMQLDRSKNTLLTGGANKSTDHKTFSFLTGQTVDPSKLDLLCPGKGFGQAGAQPVPLDPVTVKVSWSGNTFSTEMLQKINIPIFDTTVASNPPVILPLQEAYMKDVTVSADNNCIGSWDSNYYCGVSEGWTTDGVLIGKITADDADQVPVSKVGCSSLCALLVGDATKTDSTGHCLKGSDGKVVAGYGDSCVGGQGCNNAFLLSATFSAYGVAITNAPTPSDAGADSASDVGTDAGTDASDASDAASGG